MQVRPAEAARLPGLGRMVAGGPRAANTSVSLRIRCIAERPVEIPGRLDRIDGLLCPAARRYPWDRAVRDLNGWTTTRYASLHQPYADYGIRETMTRRPSEITAE